MAQEYKDFADAISMRDDDYVLELQGQSKTVIFEGAQGILLDQDVGFHPHTTWSSTTSQNAREMIPADANPVAIGVTRAYTTRHGEGPIVAGDFHPGPELHNREDGWQGGFRFGSWDAIALDYASKCDLIDEVAVTCLDHIAEDWSSVWSYDYEGDMPDLHPYFWAEGRRIFSITPGDDRAHVEAIATRLKRCTCNINHHRGVGPEYIADAIGEVLHAPVTIQSFGPTHTDKKTRVFA